MPEPPPLGNNTTCTPTLPSSNRVCKVGLDQSPTTYREIILTTLFHPSRPSRGHDLPVPPLPHPFATPPDAYLFHRLRDAAEPSYVRSTYVVRTLSSRRSRAELRPCRRCRRSSCASSAASRSRTTATNGLRRLSTRGLVFRRSY